MLDILEFFHGLQYLVGIEITKYPPSNKSLIKVKIDSNLQISQDYNNDFMKAKHHLSTCWNDDAGRLTSPRNQRNSTVGENP